VLRLIYRVKKVKRAKTIRGLNACFSRTRFSILFRRKGGRKIMKSCSKLRQCHYRTLLWRSPNSHPIVRESRRTTGKILWGERVKVARMKEVQASSPRIETTPLKPGEIKAELWTDQQFYKIGEPMVINFRASQDCYVTLLNVGTSGIFICFIQTASGGPERCWPAKSMPFPPRKMLLPSLWEDLRESRSFGQLPHGHPCP
jgi:hypothetical protein